MFCQIYKKKVASKELLTIEEEDEEDEQESQETIVPQIITKKQ